VGAEGRFGAKDGMAAGNQIQALREARGLSRPKLGQLMGTSGQQVERLEKGMRRLTQDWIERAADALNVAPVAIISYEISDSATPPEEPIPEPNASVFRMEGASSQRMHRDMPVYGTALGADEIIDGEAIEQTTLNRGDIVEYKKRPPILDGRADVYGLTVQGSSMSPVYQDGRTVFVEGRKRPAIGDDAVIYLCSPNEMEGEVIDRVLIKRVVRKTAAYVELEQFTPAKVFKLSMERVHHMDRVLTLDDLIG
jgi:phage repressor protein C with HTH and peptisase S24 domain